MINMEITSELDATRQQETELLPWALRFDRQRGPLAEIYEDRPIAKCLGIFTVEFAERFCNETPGYVWRAI